MPKMQLLQMALGLLPPWIVAGSDSRPQPKLPVSMGCLIARKIDFRLLE
jgi:hypothetical protein